MHNDEMTDATKLAPCPLCGDLMKVTNAGTFGHTDSNAECLLAKYAWGDEPQFVAAWNTRATPSPEVGLADELHEVVKPVIGACLLMRSDDPRLAHPRLGVAIEVANAVVKHLVLRTPTPADRAEKAEALLREARKNIGPLVRFHETGGHEGDGSDGALDHAVATLTAIDAHLAGESGQGDEA